MGFLPPLLDMHLLDEARTVEEGEARSMCRRLAKEEGLLVGTSTGLNVAAAVALAKEAGSGKTSFEDGGRMEIAEKIKVLIVDDEQLIADSLSWVLNMEGFETCVVYSGEEAVAIAGSFRPDALICDVLMTGISGVETAARISEKFPAFSRDLATPV